MKEKDIIYSRKVTCPVCSNKFTSMKTMESKLRVASTDSDLFTRYKTKTHPLKYNTIVCANCGYSALEENFKAISAKKKQIIEEKVTPRWVRQDYTGTRTLNESIICFKLVLYCTQITGARKAELAGICLKIAWLYRLKEDKEENTYLELSKKLYEQSFKEEDNVMDELTLLYLIGELNKRLGNMDEAITWISRVISSPYIKNNPQIEKLARDQWEELKEYRTAQKESS